MNAKEFLKQKGISNSDFMDSGVADLIETLLTEYQSLQLQQTGVIKSFYCNSDATLEKRCDKQCSWCRSYEMIME